jgi:hypothetical protein
VIVVVQSQLASLVQGVGPLALGGGLHLAVVAHQGFHVRGGAAAGDLQEVVLILRRRDADLGAHFGVAHLAAAKGFADPGQGLEAAGDAHLVVDPHRGDATFSGEPVGTGTHTPVAPSPAAIELGDEAQQAIVGGLEGHRSGPCALENAARPAAGPGVVMPYRLAVDDHFEDAGGVLLR